MGVGVLRVVCIVGIAFAMAPAASAQIFKCTAKNGLDLYQNFPCEVDSLGSLPRAPSAGKATSQLKSIQSDPRNASTATPVAAPRSAGDPRTGMSADEVTAMWGEPTEIVQDEPPSGRIEIWQYGDGRIVHINTKRRVTAVLRQ